MVSEALLATAPSRATRTALAHYRPQPGGYQQCERRLRVRPAQRRAAMRMGIWGTQYAGREQANGIDELGYLPSRAMLSEVLMWRAMVAPIRATTGINTKLLVALELGIPLVVTTAAAIPLGLDLVANASAMAPPARLADEPAAFVRRILQLQDDDELWGAASQEASTAFGRMEAADPAGSDMSSLLALVCATATDGGRHRRQVSAARSRPTPHRTNLLKMPWQQPALAPCTVVDGAAVCLHK